MTLAAHDGKAEAVEHRLSETEVTASRLLWATSLTSSTSCSCGAWLKAQQGWTETPAGFRIRARREAELHKEEQA